MVDGLHTKSALLIVSSLGQKNALGSTYKLSELESHLKIHQF